MAQNLETWTYRCGVCGVTMAVTEWGCGCVCVVREIAAWGCWRCHRHRAIDNHCGRPGEQPAH